MHERYERYFLRKYRYRYWLVLVNNHFDDVYTLFLYAIKHGDALLKSYELTQWDSQDEALTKTMLQAIRDMTQLSMERRDTRHLVHPGKDIVTDAVHGHGFSTTYRPDREKGRRVQ